MPAVLWFRRDLRLSDHPALLAAAEPDGDVLACYVLVPRLGATLRLSSLTLSDSAQLRRTRVYPSASCRATMATVEVPIPRVGGFGADSELVQMAGDCSWRWMQTRGELDLPALPAAQQR